MVKGKHFYIKSKLNGMVLDICGGKAEPGTEVITYHQKVDNSPNQTWWEDHLMGCIRSSMDGDLCLTISDDNILVVEKYEGPGDQHWTPAGDRIQSRQDSNMVLDIWENNAEECARVGKYAFHGGANQLWEFEYMEARMFHIVSEMNGKYLTCKDYKLKMYDSDGLDHQLWHEDKHGILYCKANEMTPSSAKGPGHKVIVDPFEPGKDCQMWTKSGNKIVNRVTPSLVLDIKGKDKSNGAKVVAFEYSGGDNQHWTYKYIKEGEDEPEYTW